MVERVIPSRFILIVLLVNNYKMRFTLISKKRTLRNLENYFATVKIYICALQLIRINHENGTFGSL